MGVLSRMQTSQNIMHCFVLFCFQWQQPMPFGLESAFWEQNLIQAREAGCDSSCRRGTLAPVGASHWPAKTPWHRQEEAQPFMSTHCRLYVPVELLTGLDVPRIGLALSRGMVRLRLTPRKVHNCIQHRHVRQNRSARQDRVELRHQVCNFH